MSIEVVSIRLRKVRRLGKEAYTNSAMPRTSRNNSIILSVLFANMRVKSASPSLQGCARWAVRGPDLWSDRVTRRLDIAWASREFWRAVHSGQVVQANQARRRHVVAHSSPTAVREVAAGSCQAYLMVDQEDQGELGPAVLVLTGQPQGDQQAVGAVGRGLVWGQGGLGVERPNAVSQNAA